MSLICCMLLSCLGSTVEKINPVKVILDTDIGDDIDDTWALGMLLGCPEIDLKLVVTATSNTHERTRLLAKILEKLGRTDVPIGTGVNTGNEQIRQEKWLGAYNLGSYPGKVHSDGVQAMIDAVNASVEPVTILAIGPLTNLKEALGRDPGIAKRARIVAMAGSVEIGYGGKLGRDPEYNVLTDIDAARTVFAAPWEITIAPLDSCGIVVLKDKRFAKVAAARDRRATTVIENYKLWKFYSQFPEGQSSVLFDTVAVYLTFDESLCEMKTVKLSVDDKGNTVPGDRGRPVHCAMGWKNLDAFYDLLVDALTGARAQK